MSEPSTAIARPSVFLTNDKTSVISFRLSYKRLVNLACRVLYSFFWWMLSPMIDVAGMKSRLRLRNHELATMPHGMRALNAICCGAGHLILD
jgi:hypothetical protein